MKELPVVMDSVGVYISVPFCKAKCSFCNFASDVFAAGRMQGYVERVCREMREAEDAAVRRGAVLPRVVDTVYFGGGTPSLLPPELVRQIFGSLRECFDVLPDAEITVECAPGQLAEETLDEMLQQGVNRLSFGVQSFVDRECAAVGRSHTRQSCLAELERVSAAGVGRVSLDLIAGLPLQTEASWLESVEVAIASGVEHVSVYMLEVDEDSRLGREALAGGLRYYAPNLPPDDAMADWYLAACERLSAAGVAQYEISNFARPGGASRHNLKYWERAEYVGFGLDAHSMLRSAAGGMNAVRWANGAELAGYVAGGEVEVDRVDGDAAFEEALFLGLRLNRGVSLARLREGFGVGRVASIAEPLREVESAGLLGRAGDWIRLTDAGRVASNEVFSRLLLVAAE